jgi:outer membrane immunogenic protein
MKGISILAIAAAMMVSGGAFAADLAVPVKADPAIEMATSNWDGFYVGLNAGYGWGNRTGDGSIGVPVSAWDYDLSGGLVGAQAGFNYQLDNNLVLGVEVSGDVANITGSDASQVPLGGGAGTYNMLTTATAKLGYATDKFMVYVDGGYALANFNFNGSAGCGFSQTNGGLTAGVGASMKVSDNVSVDLNYHHVWFQDAAANCTVFGVLPVSISDAASADVVKLGVNYRFGN